MSSSPFPPAQPMLTSPQPTGGAYAQSGPNFGGTPMSAGQTWLFNQSGMVVLMFLGLMGLWYIGHDHITEIRVMLTEEKTDRKSDRKEFIQAIEACCKDRDKKLSSFGSGQ